MKLPSQRQALDDAHRRLEREQTLEIHLETLDLLLAGDDGRESGIDALAGVLTSARRLPGTLVVHALVGERRPDEAAVEDDFRERCRARSLQACRTALAVRRNGVRQLPRAVVIAAGFGFFAAGTGYAATDVVEAAVLVALLYVVAGISMIGAWASAWLPIEQTLFDWRAPAYEADAYDLLSRARVEIQTDGLRRPAAVMPLAGSAPPVRTRRIHVQPRAGSGEGTTDRPPVSRKS